MKQPGCFIVVEGLEGAGKTTAIQTIKSHLTGFIPHVLVTREPGGTKLGETLRNLMIKVSSDEPIVPTCELLLMYAARVQLVEQVIQPTLSAGDWVISDRFELSSYAYQGGGRGIDERVIAQLSQVCLKDFKPDLTIFLDIEPEEGLKRVKQRGVLDKIEQESEDFFFRAYRSYHNKIKDLDHCFCVDASAPLASVQENIISILDRFLGEHER